MAHLALFLLFIVLPTALIAGEEEDAFTALKSLKSRKCSSTEFTPGSPYELALLSIFKSLVIGSGRVNGGSATATTADLYGRFQCRADLPDVLCRICVSYAVDHLQSFCPTASTATLQLEGCSLSYDTSPFLGV